MTIAEPPETVPNSPVSTPDKEGEGQIDGRRKYDSNGFYIGTIQDDGSVIYIEGDAQ